MAARRPAGRAADARHPARGRWPRSRRPARGERFDTRGPKRPRPWTGALLAAPSGAPPWPLFRGDATRSGAGRRGARPRCRRLWNARLGAIAASPWCRPRLVLCPTADGRLIFLDRASGRRVHEMPLGSAVESTPALDADTRARGHGRRRAGRRRHAQRRAAVPPEARAARALLSPAGRRTRVRGRGGRQGPARWSRRTAQGKLRRGRASWARCSRRPRSPATLRLDRQRRRLAARGGPRRRAPCSCGRARSGARSARRPRSAGDRAVVGGLRRPRGGREPQGRPRRSGRATWVTRSTRRPASRATCASMGCHEGHLHGLDARDRRAALRGVHARSRDRRPSAAGDLFLAGSTDGDLYLVDGTGSVPGAATLSQRGVQSSPALDGDRVYVGQRRTACTALVLDAMKSLRVPAWLASGVLERYHAGASHLFLLHGNVRDVHPFGEDYVAAGRAAWPRSSRRRPTVVSYDVSSGPGLPRRRAREGVHGRPSASSGAAPAGSGPRARSCSTRCSRADRCPPGSVAIVIDYAHASLPPGRPAAPERQNDHARSRAGPRIRASPARRPLVVLIAPTAADVSRRGLRGRVGRRGGRRCRGRTSTPRARLRAPRCSAATPGIAWEMTPRGAGGRDGRAVARADGGHRPARAERGERRSAARPIVERKIDLLRAGVRRRPGDPAARATTSRPWAASSTPSRELQRGGGHHAARADVRRAHGHHPHGPARHRQELPGRVLRQGVRDALRALPPAAQMYVGQSERNQEKAFSAIRALAPVVVIVDESDQAEGGSRDQGSGDSGVTERMRASGLQLLGATARCAAACCASTVTNRVDLIDSAMRRSGPHRPQDPDPDARRAGAPADLRGARCGSTGCASTIKDFAPFAGAHRRLHGQRPRAGPHHRLTASRCATARSAIADAHLSAALDDLHPDRPATSAPSTG